MLGVKRSREIRQPLEGAGPVQNVLLSFLQVGDTRADEKCPFFVPTLQSPQVLKIQKGTHVC